MIINRLHIIELTQKEFFNNLLSGGYTIPGGVTSIGDFAFYYCVGLTNVTIPGSVTNLAFAFFDCYNLASVYFQGNAPTADWSVFYDDVTGYGAPAAAYYLPRTTGWSAFSADTGIPAVLWNPLIQTGDGGFGVQNNQFGFNITGTTNIPIVVEGCTNLASPAWTLLQALYLTNGSFYFSDPQWTNYPGCYYRIRSP